MEQSEKENLILRELYNHKNDGTLYSIKLICQSLNIPIENFWELQEISNKLQVDGYINAKYTVTDCYAELTSDGIEYWKKK